MSSKAYDKAQAREAQAQRAQESAELHERAARERRERWPLDLTVAEAEARLVAARSLL